jgi:RNA polymerase sigma-70 factor (ECF subfamily)
VPADAADAVAETLLVAWRRPDALPQDAEGARRWLIGVARGVLANQRRTHLRSRALAARVAALMSEVRVAPPDPEALAVGTALAALPAGDRELLTLVAWEGLTPAEAAAVVGVGAAAARKRLQRARERLQVELTRQGIHPRPAAVG